MNHEQSARRHFLHGCGIGLGATALAQLLEPYAAAGTPATDRKDPLAPKPPHFTPKAEQVIYLFMAGGPSQFELFADKPMLNKLNGQPPPKSLMEGKRFAFLKGNEKLMGTKRKFRRHGQCGMELSDTLPHMASVADELCWLRGMTTDVFNHGPAKLFTNTGFQIPGRPSLGSWLTYGLGSPSKDLPGFVVLQSGPRGPRAGNTLWSSGFLPTTHQGVPFRNSGEAILDLQNPPGYDRERQRATFDLVGDLNRAGQARTADPEIETRINAFEMAFRMQASAPELLDLGKESKATLAAYGVEPGKPSFALNCLLARRMIERGVRMVQLYHTDWDHHGGKAMDLDKDLPSTCREVDQPIAALIRDLKSRGLMAKTLVVWGGEFGRTPMGEMRETTGRDHHVAGYTMWLAGAGVKAGLVHGATDELGFGPTTGKVHVHDLNATILHLLGFDHEKLSFRFQGRDYRLTDVHGQVVKEILA